MKSIIILVDYFGAWPGWFPVFLASCRFNSTIHWLIRTDCEIPSAVPENVRFISTRFPDYVEHVGHSLNVDFRPSGAYKICDIRPMCGDIFYDDIKAFDYFGFGDLDVIYGDIRQFYTDDVLTADVISNHVGILSGHLCLFKNTERLRKAYLGIPQWKKYMENPESTRFDEDVFSYLFFRYGGQTPLDLLLDRLRGYAKGALQVFQRPKASGSPLRVYAFEQYSTVFHPMKWHDGRPDHPDVWYWKDGAITNERDGKREFLYLHLMNFQSMRWTSKECRDRNTCWKNNPNVVFTSCGEELNGVRIDWNGVHALPPIDTQSRNSA